MNTGKIISFITLLCIGLCFQNCEGLSQQQSFKQNSGVSESPSIIEDDDASNSEERRPSLETVELYNFNHVINGFRLIEVRTGLHTISYPYDSVEYYPEDTEKGQIVYFKCSTSDYDDCIEELSEAGNDYCKEIGALSSRLVDIDEGDGLVLPAGSPKVTGPDDPYFTIRLKSGELIETSYQYQMCYDIDLEMFNAKRQPVR